jgi:hypothetical protein
LLLADRTNKFFQSGIAECLLIVSQKDNSYSSISLAAIRISFSFVVRVDLTISLDFSTNSLGNGAAKLSKNAQEVLVKS